MMKKIKLHCSHLWMNQLDTLNIILIISALFFCVYLLGKQGQYGKKNIDSNYIPRNRVERSLPKLNSTKQTLAYYEQILTKRRLFAIKSNPEKLKITPVISLDDNIAVQISDLQLQGVISGGQVRQAIILNCKTDKTYYCQGGENIGGFIIKEVYENKVIFEKDEQLTELRL